MNVTLTFRHRLQTKGTAVVPLSSLFDHLRELGLNPDTAGLTTTLEAGRAIRFNEVHKGRRYVITAKQAKEAIV